MGTTDEFEICIMPISKSFLTDKIPNKSVPNEFVLHLCTYTSLDSMYILKTLFHSPWEFLIFLELNKTFKINKSSMGV